MPRPALVTSAVLLTPGGYGGDFSNSSGSAGSGGLPDLSPPNIWRAIFIPSFCIVACCS